MGNRPFKPVTEPAQVAKLEDAETRSVLVKRFGELANRSGTDRTSFTVEDLAALDPGFTAKWGTVIVARLFDTMDLEGSKAVSQDAFFAAAYSVACGTPQSRARLLFNMFDVSHKGEIGQADFIAVYAEVCKASIEPLRVLAPSAAGGGGAGAAAAASRPARPVDASKEMLAALGEVAGKGLHNFYDTTASGRLSVAEFEALVAQEPRLEVLRGDISALLAPGLLG